VTICVGLGRVRRQRLCAFELLRGGIRSPLRGSSPTCSASPVSVGRVGLQVQPIIEPVLCGTPGSLTLGLRFDSSWDENDSRSGRDPLSTSIPGPPAGGPIFSLEFTNSASRSARTTSQLAPDCCCLHSCCATGKTASGDVLVAVRDSGPGLALAALERVFDPFYTSKPGGLGMGLSICRSIIEAHGGRLWVSANVTRGATFQFTVPT
jgi:Histidine kinase-, DNA gyrase B-, and HSP90-like ATPase